MQKGIFWATYNHSKEMLIITFATTTSITQYSHMQISNKMTNCLLPARVKFQ